jgi:hypothetical protein
MVNKSTIICYPRPRSAGSCFAKKPGDKPTSAPITALLPRTGVKQNQAGSCPKVSTQPQRAKQVRALRRPAGQCDHAMIERITFNTSGWHEHERSEERVVWGNAGDILSLDVVPRPWQTFKPMERERWLTAARRCGIRISDLLIIEWDVAS